MTLSIIDIEWNKALDAAIEQCRHMQLVLRSQNGESEEWVWPAATSIDWLIHHIDSLKRRE